MIDITLAWFPALKILFTIGFIYGGYYFYKTKRYKVSVFYALILALFWIIMPIKYDGTNITQHNIQTQNQRTIDYKSVTSDAIIYTTKKPTFEERMKAEDERSEDANQKIIDEIIK